MPNFLAGRFPATTRARRGCPIASPDSSRHPEPGRRFGPLTVIPGSSDSLFPYCTSLLVDGGRERALIDPGAGEEALGQAVAAGGVDLLINTHCHFDHI